MKIVGRRFLHRSIYLLVASFCAVFGACPCEARLVYLVEPLSTAPRISFIAHFLTDKECDHLIQLAKPQLTRSWVVDDYGNSTGIFDDRRTSMGAFLDNDLNDSILQGIERRIETLTQVPAKRGELLQVLHYEVGGEYQPHYDYFSPNTPGGQTALARSGQRLVTLIMYLNTPEEGGETIFPIADLAITPQKGSAVLFYNCDPEGREDPTTLHGGAPVKAGEKWIATRWIREKDFQ